MRISLPFLLLTYLFLPLLLLAQNKTEAIIAGKNIAVVSTESGKVRGYIHKGIYTYKGIPYAYASRFMAPAKPKPWSGVRSSTTYGPVCPTDPTTTVNDEIEFAFQHNWGYANEHCQTLNVWTRGINDGKKRPVMVWLHGGGFSAGSAVELPAYDGENLSRKGDVVVVSINHRLNVLGFLDLSAYGEKYKDAANAGMLDIVAALQWVQQNIGGFGGDPGNVTIFGQSGGGRKVSALLYAPAAKGLFHKAIVQSGSGAVDFLEPEITRRIAAATLEALGLEPAQVDSLQTIPYERLAAAGKKALNKVGAQLKAEGKTVAGFGLGLNWGPVHDGRLLPYQLSDDAAMEVAKNIPLLVGSNKNEAMAFVPGLNELTMEQVKASLQKQYGDQTEAYMQAVQKAYPNTTLPVGFVDIDFRYRPMAVKQANRKATAGAAPVYLYLFTWQSPVNDGMYKAMHCMELPFVFNNIQRCEEMTGGGKEAYALAEKISSAWINFAHTGNPNAKGLPNWPAYTPQNGATMIFDNQCVIKNHHDKELLELVAAKPVL